MYLHKYPPATGTTSVPLFDSSNLAIADSQLKKKTLCDFWASRKTYQANLNWKGGEWGSNNLPTTDTTWMTGVFIGDEFDVEVIANGIIPFGIRKGLQFESIDAIITGSESSAWSCNLYSTKSNCSLCCTSSAIAYSGYMCNKPMPQSALDVLFVWSNSKNETFINILKRGNSNPNVDMPGSFMPGGGEHKEPGKDVKIKSGIIRCINEEMGISKDTLAECYLLNLGKFNKKDRDPRYGKFSWIQDEQLIEFGIERDSETEVFVLYLQSNTDETPKDVPHLDQIEVKSKVWKKMDDPELESKEIWMIPEHGEYIPLAQKAIEELNLLSDKSAYKFNIMK